MMYKTFLWVRACLFYMVFTVLSIICAILITLTVALPFKVRNILGRSWSRSMIYACKYICGLDFEVQGYDNLINEPVVFLSKHQSAWETIAFLGMLPPNCFVFKKSLAQIPFFGWGMALSHNIPIDRSKGIKAFKAVITLGKQRLSEGLSIVIFPEGTRVPPKTDAKFFKTAAGLAKAAGAKVIPIAHNSGSCWRRNSFIKYPGKITVVIGKAIDTKALSIDEINATAYQWIHDTMKVLEK